jgi:hypothetical protein
MCKRLFYAVGMASPKVATPEGAPSEEASKTQRNHKEILKNLVKAWCLGVFFRRNPFGSGNGSGLLKQFLRATNDNRG